ncbi:MAG: NAD(P)H-dependent oxidoreductase subunit E, partial [Prevotellaceae bacterium]|nr:NAD(P)H-dependent oxidoreductase subunit E [Prevotellaceae bacterium]
HVKGAGNVYDSFVRELNIPQGSVTTEDLRYSVEKVACLGCCTLAPVVQIDEKTYGHVAPGKVAEVLADFETLQLESEQKKEAHKESTTQCEVRLGVGSCCMASGSADIYEELISASRELGIEVNIKPVGCVGVCSKVPLIDVVTPEGEIVRYPNVKAIEIKEILHHHFQSPSLLKRVKNKLLNSLDSWHTDITWDNVVWKSEEKRTKIINSFLEKQLHISTEGYGKMTPLSVDEYKANQGFEGLRQALAMECNDVVKSILDSGIRGRGGGGFPTGKKWEIVAAQPGEKKYIICNGDEGDPGAFMDRMLLESYPFRVIEGLLVGAYAVGASEGYFYIRAEYPLAVKRVSEALKICRENNLLGKNILGSNFSFDIQIFEGAGAFVCGEETALIASIEGERGFPKQRPPFPAQKGLFGFPTLVNNVETLSQIPYIIRNGAQDFAAVGTGGSSGTKVFALAGKVRNGGLIEVPMGITLNEIVYDIGGGVGSGRKFKAVQIGGPSGGCIPASLCDTKVSFDNFTKLGAMMGSGGMVTLDDRDCMVDMARYFLTFTCEQSCGKCTFCRVGIRRMLDILEKICRGEGQPEDLDTLETLAHSVKIGSMCGLGRGAPNPVLTTLKYFREEYEAHINGACPTGTCREMTALLVNDKCIGCTKCAKACPVEAIEYVPYEKHSIDTSKCTLCGLCLDECSYEAIEFVAKKSLVNG